MSRAVVVFMLALLPLSLSLPTPPSVLLAPKAKPDFSNLALRGGMTENQVAQVASGIYLAGSIPGLMASESVMKMYGMQTGPAEVNAFRILNYSAVPLGIILLLIGVLGKTFREGVGISSMYWFFWILYQSFHGRGLCKKFSLPKNGLLPWALFHFGVAFAAFSEHLEDFSPIIYGCFVLGLLNNSLIAFNTRKFHELFDLKVKQSPASSIVWRSAGCTGLGLAFFLIIYNQTQSLGSALAPALAIQTLNYAYAVARQEWRAMKMPNGVGVLLYGLVYAALTCAALFSKQ